MRCPRRSLSGSCRSQGNRAETPSSSNSAASEAVVERLLPRGSGAPGRPPCKCEGESRRKAPERPRGLAWRRLTPIRCKTSPTGWVRPSPLPHPAAPRSRRPYARAPAGCSLANAQGRTTRTSIRWRSERLRSPSALRARFQGGGVGPWTRRSEFRISVERPATAPGRAAHVGERTVTSFRSSSLRTGPSS
jgi:hypothetical protein